MAEKRKDSKGRILRTGEYQRANGLYQYRYKDTNGKLKAVCSIDLTELREKEKQIQKDIADNSKLENIKWRLCLLDKALAYYDSREE